MKVSSLYSKIFYYEHKAKCSIGLEEITIKILDPEEYVLTKKRGLDGKYIQVPRKETKQPRYEVSCPKLEALRLADLPQFLKEGLLKEGRHWCKKMNSVCPHEYFMPSLLYRALGNTRARARHWRYHGMGARKHKPKGCCFLQEARHDNKVASFSM